MRSIAPYLLLLFLFSFAFRLVQQTPIFKAYEQGTISSDEGTTRGAAFGDVDGDGVPELYAANTQGQSNVFYQLNDAGEWVSYSENEPAWFTTVNYKGRSEGVNWVDYDNDGDLDLYICSRGYEPNQLFQNEAGQRLKKIEDHPLVQDSLSSSMACWADFEGDGDLDVIVIGYRYNGNLVFENLGGGRFEEKSGHLMSEGEGRSRACACGDVNNDGLPEIFVARARQSNFYYVNRGDWQFESIRDGLMVEDQGYAYGASWADYDDDGDLDLFVANFDKENLLLSNDGEGGLTPVEEGEIVKTKAGASKGHSWGDYDNDGDLDIYIGNGTYGPDMRNFLFLNDGNGSFERYAQGVIETHADTTAGVTHADFDRDGDLDLFVATWGSHDQLNRLYVNQTSGRNWVSFRLKGTQSNSYGIGTQVTLYFSKAGATQSMHRWMYPVSGYGSQNDLELHFGLGEISRIDSVVAKWPQGSREVHLGLKVNQHYQLTEGASFEIAK